jgi:intein/homing endonuclease
MSGKTTTATLTHSFLKRTTKGIDPVLGSDLKLGDRIPVVKDIPEHKDALLFKQIGEFGNIPLTRDFGWLCGAYMADGCSNDSRIQISKIIPEYRDKIKEVVEMIFEIPVKYAEHERLKKFTNCERVYKGGVSSFNSKILSQFFTENFGENSHKKSVPGWVFFSNTEFIAGFLGGYFDGDGSANCQIGKQMIRNGSVSERLTSDVIILLAYVGIFASKCIENPKCIKVPFHTIQISKKYAEIFKNKIGFIVKDKADNLDKIIEYINRENKVDEKEYIDKIPELGNIIDDISRALKLPHTHYKKLESIGRRTLIKNIKVFEEANLIKKNEKVTENIEILKQAAYSNVVWDKIVKLEYLDDPKEYVYDFTVPGNDSFMVDTGILVHNTLNTSMEGLKSSRDIRKG